MIVFALLLVAPALAAACVQAPLETCAFMQGRCVEPVASVAELARLGIHAASAAERVVALDARIGEAISGAGDRCRAAARYFLCSRHLAGAHLGPECRSACATYVAQCGSRLGWPIDYVPCAGYDTPCVCETSAGQLTAGQCRTR